jgi:hypothetical protein
MTATASARALPLALKLIVDISTPASHPQAMGIQLVNSYSQLLVRTLNKQKVRYKDWGVD